MFDWKSRSLLPRLLYIVQCRNRYRPQDNNIEWWKSYIAEFFSSNSVVRLSVKDMPAFQPPQSVIPSSLTNTEVPFEVLPRLFQFKYEKGVQEELLFLGNVIESPLPGGGTSIICYQAAESLVFEGFNLVQYGHLKVVFNANLKVQLLDFNVTGYDLHLNHRVIQSEIRNLCQVLESRCQSVGQLVSNPGQAPDFRAAAESLKYAVDYTRHFSEALERYLSFEWSYIQKVLHFMQMADVISSMHELFYHCNTRRLSPLQALQQYGKVSVRQGGDSSAQDEEHPGTSQNSHPQSTASPQASTSPAPANLGQRVSNMAQLINQMSQHPLGQNPLGQNPMGQNPLGQNLVGQNSLGQNLTGQNSLGQNPLGQNPLGPNAMAQAALARKDSPNPGAMGNQHSPQLKGPLGSTSMPPELQAAAQQLGMSSSGMSNFSGLHGMNSMGMPKGLPGSFFMPNAGQPNLPQGMAARFNPQLAMNLMSGQPDSPGNPQQRPHMMPHAPDNGQQDM